MKLPEKALIAAEDFNLSELLAHPLFGPLVLTALRNGLSNTKYRAEDPSYEEFNLEYQISCFLNRIPSEVRNDWYQQAYDSGVAARARQKAKITA